MKKLARIDMWLMAMLLAVLANGASAGLIVTDPVETSGEHLIVAGDYYTSITITEPNFYGMGAFGGPYDIYIGASADPCDRQALTTDITVTVSSGRAYCMWVPHDTIYADGIAGNLSATGTSWVFGMRSGSVDLGAISGTIEANATSGSDASGIGTWYSIDTGAISGSITATAAGDGAYGIWSDYNDVTIASITETGSISATAGGDGAYGINAIDIYIPGGIAGTITADANNDAYGINSNGGTVTIGDISGTITATVAGDNARAILAEDGSINIGNISGDISATAANGSATGISAPGGDHVQIGDISGTISVTAGGPGAYGLDSSGYVETGDISGSITVAAANGAWGLYSDLSYVSTGAISGSIDANTTGSGAYGISATDTVTIASITETGSISATAGGDGAYAIYTTSPTSVYIPGGVAGAITADANNDAYGIWSDGLVSIGGISGSITATAADSNAYGISAYGAVSTGDISGSIDATAGGNTAYGIYANGQIVTGIISGNVTATAGGDGAYGIYAEDSLEIGDVSGEITATAGGSTAYGLHSYDSYMEVGDVSGTISATAASDARAIYAEDSDLYVENITGTISAEATSGSGAYAIDADYDVQISSIGESALIEAYAALGDAYGISAGDNVYILGDIDGDITATADGGSNAYGIYAYHNIDIDDITGDITSTADGDGAYGIFGTDADDGPGYYVEIDNISGNITAYTDGANAYAVLSSHGSLDTGDISGNITATAGGDWAVGLYAYQSELDIDDLTGSVSAEAANNAYAIEADESDFYADSINGNISAYSYGDNAYGIYADGDIEIDSIDYNGYIDAYAGGTEAYAIYGGGNITIGDIAGTLRAEAQGGAEAYVDTIYADGYISIGDITGDVISICAGDADGIWSNNSYISIGNIMGTVSADGGNNSWAIDAWDHVHIDSISGSVTATADDFDTYAIASWNSYVDIGDITGTISAYTYGDYAYGISADANVAISSISGYGSISATADEGYDAYGISAGGNVTIGSISTYDYDHTISAYAGYDNAYGIYADGDVAITSISDYYYGYGYGYSAIDAYAAGDNAYGIYAGGDVTIGSISDYYYSDSAIDVYAGGYNAYGIYAGGDVTISSINADISAEAGYDYAAGIYAGGDILFPGGIGAGTDITGEASYCAAGIYSDSGDIDTGTISGNVSADVWDDSFAYAIAAGGALTATVGSSGSVSAYAEYDDAYALAAYGPLDILIDGGSVIAEAGDGDAYAISSGFPDAFREEDRFQDVPDFVEIVSGSTVVGNIDLGYDGGESYEDELDLTGYDYNTGYITGDMANIELIEIYGGTWYVLGDAYNNENGIYMEDGVLNWQGSVEDLWIDGGTFSPGNSIGTTTVLGDFWLDSDTTFVVEVDDDENADLVDVSGTAYLYGGAIQPVPDGEYFITHPFQATVLSAEGGFSEGYDEFVEEWTPFFDYGVIYDTSDPCDSLVVLDIERAGFFAETKNEHAVAGALDHVIAGGDMDCETQDLLVELRTLQHEDWLEGGNGNPRLLDELTPQDAMGLAQVTGATMGAFSDSMFDRMSNLLVGRPFSAAGFGQKLRAKADIKSDEWLVRPGSQPTDKWMPFIKGIGSWGDQDGEKGVSGYRYNVYGMTAGADKLIDDNWLVGIAFGGSRADVDYDKAGTSADIDTAMVALYGSYFKDNWHIDLDLSYGYNWYDSERTVQIGMFNKKARSDHNGSVYSAAVQAGVNLGDQTTIIEPIIGAGYAAIQEDGYTEKGADPVNLKVDSHTTDSYYAKLGMRLAALMREQDNVVLVPEIGVFYIADLSDESELDSAFGDGSAFTVEGLEPDDALNVRAAINAYFSNNWRLFLNYDWRTASDLDSHTVKGGIQWDF